MMATGAVEEVVEVGYFGPGQFIPCEELSAGMVGYFTASIKNIRDARVGDTVTEDERPCSEPLPGYKSPQPMVYCGLYPADSARYPDLRDALEKLQLNDASLFFEPETSLALGFGFRCGFLGLLHMEVILQRLEREYDLDLISTSPGVVYKVYKNTMMKRAFEGTPCAGLDDLLNGPSAMAVAKDDATAPARILAEFAKKAKKLEIKGGVVEGDVYDAAGIGQIATVPTREVLLGRLFGSWQSPIASFARVIKQIAEKDGEGAAPAVEAPAAE
jgi:ribosomal protein L10